MTKLQDAPVRSKVPAGGYVLISEPTVPGSAISTFAKVPASALGGGPAPSGSIWDNGASVWDGGSSLWDVSTSTALTTSLPAPGPTATGVIDPTKPVFGNPTTQSVRDNFAVIKTQLDALPINVKSLGAKGDGTTDDTAAFVAAIAAAATHAYGSKIVVPAGRYMLSSTLTVTLTGCQATMWEGDGSANTELFWTSDTDGIVATLENMAWLRDTTKPGCFFGMRGISLVRAFASEGKRALSISGLAAQTYGGRNVDLADILLRGVPGMAGWQNGVQISALSNCYLDRIYFHVAEATFPGTGTAIALTTTDTFFSTEHHLSNCQITGANIGFSITNHVEGITVANSDFVACNIGIYGVGGPNNDSDQLTLTGVHIDSRQFGIKLTGINTLQAFGTYFLAHGGGPPGGSSTDTYTAIDLTNGARHSIIGCMLIGRPTSTNQVFCRITNDATFQQNTAANITGNHAITLSGPMVVLGDQTINAMVCGNYTMNTHSVFGIDPSKGSTFTGNSINGGTGLSHAHQFDGLVQFHDVDHYPNFSMILDGSTSPTGYQIWMRGNGSTAPDKTLAVTNGQFQVRNNANSAPVFTVDDSAIVQTGQVLCGAAVLGNATVAGPAYLDFRSSGLANTSDVRFIVTGGTATTGKGNLLINAALLSLDAQVTMAYGLGVFGVTPPAVRPTVLGSRGGNAALASLLTALAATGLLVDGSTA